MIGRLIDKLIFAATLFLALQVPQLADQYQQFLAGLYESTHWQVQGYNHTAKNFGYPDANAMIQHHRQNSVPSVRADAEQKLATLAQFELLKQGVTLFTNGNLISKTLYMAAPSRYHYLKKTLDNFTPGIPLSTEGITFGVIVGLLLNLLIMAPIRFANRRILRICKSQPRAKPNIKANLKANTGGKKPIAAHKPHSDH